MTCKVEGCLAPSAKRGMCNAHYLRAWRYGDPLAGATCKGALLKWLQEHVAYDGGDCLKWPFGNKGNGYGHLKFEGRKTTASNAMCKLANGPAPSHHHEAAHSCGNGHRGCVNPRHLRWATRLENVHDAIAHGTAARGPVHSAAIKLGRQRARLDVPVQTLTEEARNAA